MLLKVCAWYVLRKALSRPSTPDRDNSVVLFPITYIDVTGLDTQLHPFDWLFNLSTNQQINKTITQQSHDSPQTVPKLPRLTPSSPLTVCHQSPHTPPTVPQQSPSSPQTDSEQSPNSPSILPLIYFAFWGAYLLELKDSEPS